MNRFEVVSNEFAPFVVVQFLNQYNVCVGFGVMHNNKFVRQFGSIEKAIQAASDLLEAKNAELIVETMHNLLSEIDFQPAPATALDLDSEFDSNMKKF